MARCGWFNVDCMWYQSEWVLKTILSHFFKEHKAIVLLYV